MTRKLPQSATDVTTLYDLYYWMISTLKIRNPQLALKSGGKINEEFTLDEASLDTIIGNLFAESDKMLCIWWYISLQCIAVLSGCLEILYFLFMH